MVHLPLAFLYRKVFPWPSKAVNPRVSFGLTPSLAAAAGAAGDVPAGLENDSCARGANHNNTKNTTERKSTRRVSRPNRDPFHVCLTCVGNKYKTRFCCTLPILKRLSAACARALRSASRLVASGSAGVEYKDGLAVLGLLPSKRLPAPANERKPWIAGEADTGTLLPMELAAGDAAGSDSDCFGMSNGRVGCTYPTGGAKSSCTSHSMMDTAFDGCLGLTSSTTIS